MRDHDRAIPGDADIQLELAKDGNVFSGNSARPPRWASISKGLISEALVSEAMTSPLTRRQSPIAAIVIAGLMDITGLPWLD
jgi:hypothetical protein